MTMSCLHRFFLLCTSCEFFRGFIKHGYYWTLHGPAPAASAHFSSSSCSSWTFVHDCKFYGLVPIVCPTSFFFSCHYTPASYLSQSNHPLFHFATHTLPTTAVHYIQSDCALDQVCNVLYCTRCTFMNTSKWKCICVYCICVSLLFVLPTRTRTKVLS